MIKYLLTLIFATLWLPVALNATGNTSPEAPQLSTPRIVEPTARETTISFIVENYENTGSHTEIYRSLDGVNFTLRESVTSYGGIDFTDPDLKPRTTYYYKSRAVTSSDVSAFSDVASITTLSKYYPPELTAIATEDYKVKLIIRDHTYATVEYAIQRSDIGVFAEHIQIADSGQVYELIDANVEDNTSYTYEIHATVLDNTNRTFYFQDNSPVTTRDDPNTLATPALGPTGTSPSGAYIEFYLYQPEEGATIEIFRSAGGLDYARVFPETPDGSRYVDHEVKPRTEYLYKARATRDGVVSDFSDPIALVSGSNFYAPVFEADLFENTKVKVTLTDRSFADSFYDIHRWPMGRENERTFVGSAAEMDSASTQTLIDTAVVAGETYVYSLDVYYNYEGSPSEENYDTDTVTVPGSPTTLETPYFAPLDDRTVDQTDLSFYIINPDPEASTELYRTTDPSAGYTLIETLAPSSTDYHYTDYDLKPRTTFYYKLRSVKGDQASLFSDSIRLTTVSRLYEPGFEIEPQTAFLGFEITFTDRSYGDYWYDIYRVESGTTNSEFVTQLEMLDSGRTVIFQDGGTISPRTDYYYEIVATGNGEAYPQYYWTSETVTSLGDPNAELFPPSWDGGGSPPSFPCGSEIALTFSNPDPEASTEIWRSLYADSGFILIASADGFYMDTEVKPHTTYYYMLRSAKDEVYSEFSEARSFTSGSDFYAPTLSSTALPDNTVQFTLTDNTYGEGSYEVYGLDLTTGLLNGFFATIVSPDSAVVHNLIDTNIIPGHEYFYGVSAILPCDGFPVVSEFSTQVMVPESGPKILGFTLINPDLDTEVRELTDNDSFAYAGRYNIGVSASAETQSIEFYLNGKRITENQLPFSLFGDAKGNYHKGHLRPGDYVLTATPFTGTRQDGDAGPTVTIHFTVVDDKKNNTTAAEEGVLVRVFPNPIWNDATIEVTNAANSLVTITIADERGNNFQLSQDLVETKLFRRDWNASQLKRGTYFVTVHVNEKLYTTRVIVK